MKHIQFCLVSMFLMLVAFSCYTSTRQISAEEVVEKLGATTLMSDATWTLRHSVTPEKEAPMEIPKECWVGSIGKLNPIRVYNHRFNLVVVLNSSETSENGLYISALQSSYGPRDGDDNFKFRLIERSVYAFERKK